MVGDKENEQTAKASKRRPKRRWLYYLLAFLSILLIFQIAFYYYSDQFIGRVLKEVVYQGSGKVYRIDYEGLDFNIFKNEIEFENVSIEADAQLFKTLLSDSTRSNRMYELRASKLLVEGPSLFKLYFDKILTIHDFKLESPELVVHIYGELQGKEVGIRNIHQQLSQYFDFLSVDRFQIDNAGIKVINYREDKVREAHIQSISSEIYRFRMDKRLAKDSAFQVEEIHFTIGSNKYQLDSNYLLAFDSITVSVKDSLLEINGMNLSSRDSTGLPSQVNWSNDSIGFTGLDFKSAYFDKEFIAERLFMSGNRLSYKERRAGDEMALWHALSGVFKEVRIQEVVAQNSSLHYVKQHGPRKQDVILPLHTAYGQGFFIDSFSYKARKPDFFFDHLEGELRNFDLTTKDGLHVIHSRRVNVSTRNRELILSGVNITETNKEAGGKTRYNGDIVSVQAFGIDPLDFVRSNSLTCRALLLEEPNLTIKGSGSAGFSEERLNEALRKQFNGVYLSAFEIERAELQLIDGSGKEKVRAIRLSVFARNFRSFSPNASMPFLLSDEVNLELHEVAIKGFAQGHDIVLNGFKMFSEKGIFQCRELNIIPHISPVEAQSGVHLAAILRNVKTAGLNLDKLNHEGVLEMDYLESTGSNAMELAYLLTDSNEAEKNAKLAGIHIGELVIDSINQSIRFQQGLTDLSLSSQGSYLQLCDFKWDSLKQASFFDAYAVNLDGRQLAIRSDYLEHALKAKEYRISSNYELLQLNDVDLRPIKDKYQGRDALWYFSPQLKLTGIDLPAYFKTQSLTADAFFTRTPVLNVHINQSEGKSDKQSLLNRPFDFVSKFASELEVKNVRANQGKFNFYVYDNGKETHLRSNGFDLFMRMLRIDSNTTHSDSNLLFSKTSSFSLREFSRVVNDSSMTVNIDQARLMPHKGEASFEGLMLESREPRKSKRYRSLNISEGKLSSFNYFDFLTKNEIKGEKLELDGALLNLFPGSTERDNQYYFEAELPRLLTRNYGEIRFDSAFFNDAFVKLRFKKNGKTEHLKVGPWTGFVDRLHLHRNYPDLKFLYADNIIMDLKGYQYQLEDSLNTLGLGNMRINIKEQRIEVDSFYKMPRYPKYTYSKKYGAQTDWISIENNRTIIEGFDFSRFLYLSEIEADFMNCGITDIDIFRDKSLERERGTFKEMPQRMLRELPLKLDFDSIKMVKWDIRYAEQMEEAPVPGIIEFHELDGKIFGLSNYEDAIEENRTITIDVSSQLMETGQATAHLEIPINADQEAFSFNGKLSKMDMSEMNPILENLAYITIKSGEAYGLDFSGTANRYLATGEMNFYYSNLKVGVIARQTQKEGLLEKVMGWVANTFIVKGSNRLFPKTGEIYYERCPEKSIFNFGAKAIITGLKNSVGLKNKVPENPCEEPET